ncbi:sigma factor [Myxococcus fulvus]|uniref:sigma factor n=1 Tax=Myxococcus fulvus TaxID=33 RepID=UPI0020BFCB1E|nr:sigma factor [Myxococcus fulvus]MCK8502584.1 hypothetical protein [Myxococcus fulvus]
MRFAGDRELTGELTQDIFVKLYRHVKAHQSSARLKTFLFRVATNHSRSEVRQGEDRVTHTRRGAGHGELVVSL